MDLRCFWATLYPDDVERGTGVHYWFCRWNAICYGLPLRGKQVAHLKATVRSITESSCSGTDIPAFLKDLGLTHQYQLVRRGQGFELVTKTNDVVQVMRFY